jgi:GxxExxY protein
LCYKNKTIGRGKIDLLIEDRLVVELKAVERSAKQYRRQVVVYLKATGLSLGIVINFETDLLKNGLARVSHTNKPLPPRLRASASSANEMPEPDAC